MQCNVFKTLQALQGDNLLTFTALIINTITLRINTAPIKPSAGCDAIVDL